MPKNVIYVSFPKDESRMCGRKRLLFLEVHENVG